MKKIFFIFFLLISLVIINNLVRSVYSTWRKKDLLAVAQKTLEKQKAENQRLKTQLTIVSSSEFIEKEARDKLFLVKPKEQKVLLPQDLSLQTEDKKNQNQIPNWRKWLELFF